MKDRARRVAESIKTGQDFIGWLRNIDDRLLDEVAEDADACIAALKGEHKADFPGLAVAVVSFMLAEHFRKNPASDALTVSEEEMMDRLFVASVLVFFERFRRMGLLDDYGYRDGSFTVAVDAGAPESLPSDGSEGQGL